MSSTEVACAGAGPREAPPVQRARYALPTAKSNTLNCLLATNCTAIILFYLVFWGVFSCVICGTDIAYAVPGTIVVYVTTRRILLCLPYAVSGTDTAYAATRRPQDRSPLLGPFQLFPEFLCAHTDIEVERLKVSRAQLHKKLARSHNPKTQ
eukprot:1419206-Rhodomonas_salina.2